MTETEYKRKQYTIKFPYEVTVVLDNMADEEGVSVGELVRRAINFYGVRIDAKKRHRDIILEKKGEVRERIMF